jgi:hypothetical protein
MDDEMGVTRSTHESRDVYEILSGHPEEKRPLSRPRLK